MFLIDAVYINNSGGMTLLQYLIKTITPKSGSCVLLLDSRIQNSEIIDLLKVFSTFYIKANERERRKFYKTNANYFQKILCFGNVPPPIRLNAKVYTYFHNIFLLKVPDSTKGLVRFKCLIKQIYIRVLRKNTDYWIVQTQNTLTELICTFCEPKSKVLVYPFFDTCIFQRRETLHTGSNYAFVANYIPEKNHALLIDAWKLLAIKGFRPVLHLTLSNYPEELANTLISAQEVGANIINHGFCTLPQVASIYEHCKAVIYPSENESFGLGLIEAMHLGCDVIGADLSYIHSICEPSKVFNLSSKQIANAVIEYEQGNCPTTICKVNNQIHELISLITN